MTQKKNPKKIFLENVQDMGRIYQVYVKQDPEEEKNICEVLASHFMRFIANEIGENPDLIAPVNFLNKDGDIFVASEKFPSYRNLYLDAYLSYHLPAYAPLQKNVGNKWKKIPKKRPSYMEDDSCINNILLAGRYEGVSTYLALKAIVDDADAHHENAGAIPIESSTENDIIPIIKDGVVQDFYLSKKKPFNGANQITIDEEKYYQYEQAINDDLAYTSKECCIQINNKFYIIPNAKNTRVAGIDFGGAFGDFRLLYKRAFDGQIRIKYMDNFFRHYPSFYEPPAYNNKLPEGIRNGDQFFKSLALFSMIPPEKIYENVQNEVENIFLFYEQKPEIIITFAQRIGAPVFADPKQLKDSIIRHFFSNFIARQSSAKKLYLEYFCQRSRKEQQSLSYAYFQNAVVLEGSHLLMLNFYKQLKEENSQFFNYLSQIEALGENQSPTVLNRISPLKTALHQRVCKAFCKGKLEQISPEIETILIQTKDLIEKYEATKVKIADPFLAKKEKKAEVNLFIKNASLYEKQCIHKSTSTKIIKEACALLGFFLGTVIGGILGTCLGGFVGGTIGSVIPGVGNVAGAVSLGSTAAILLALKGAGIGMAVGTAAASVLLAPMSSYLFSKSTSYLLFSKPEKEARKFAKHLSRNLDEICKSAEDIEQYINKPPTT